MTTPYLPGPCEEYEHDLVELLDGTLGPEHARVVRLHVESCPRCRAWQGEFARIDARLEASLPRPVLSTEFERRLHDRVAVMARAATRGDLRTTADHDYQRVVAAIKRGARRHALLDSIGSLAVTICSLVVIRGLLEQSGIPQLVPDGPQAWLMFGAFGLVVAASALAWSTGRNALPMFDWLR